MAVPMVQSFIPQLKQAGLVSACWFKFLARMFLVAPKHLIKRLTQALGFHKLLVIQWAHIVIPVTPATLKENLHGLVGRVVCHALDV